MKSIALLEETTLVERGISLLMKKLGPIEAQRFLALSSRKRLDSVSRHRAWQKGLNQEEFFARVMR
jgi:hypothetical protein